VKRLLRAELYRLRHTPTTWVFGGLAVAASVLGTTLVLSFVDIGPGSDVTEVMSFTGSAGLVSLMLGVVWAGGDFRHRTIVPAVLLTPRRWRAVVAQLGALGLVGAVIGLVSAPITLLTGAVWLDVAGTPYQLPAAGMIGAWFGGTLHNTLSAALGGGLGTLARNQVAAAIAVFIYLGSIDPLLAQAIPDYGQFGPTALGIVLSGGSPQPGGPGQQLLPPALAAAVYLGYTALFATAGLLAARRRELP
jgi:ABC-2 type transport system permease protein